MILHPDFLKAAVPSTTKSTVGSVGNLSYSSNSSCSALSDSTIFDNVPSFHNTSSVTRKTFFAPCAFSSAPTPSEAPRPKIDTGILKTVAAMLLLSQAVLPNELVYYALLCPL